MAFRNGTTEIAVLIPHYNNLSGLHKSLSSISNIEPVDVIIVDDGSSEKPDLKELLEKYPQINNFVILQLQKNRGIEHALNTGLNYIISKGYKYVARLDCGDICHPYRFKIQREFLEKRPDIYLVGTWVEFVSTTGETLFKFKPPTKHEEIRKRIFLNNPFIHPSVMFRAEVVKSVGFYPTKYKNAEDYAYFFKIAKSHKTANIDKILLKYEVNPQSLSLSKRRLQIRSRLRVILDNFEPSIYWFWGIVRNCLLYFIPYSIVEKLKKKRG